MYLYFIPYWQLALVEQSIKLIEINHRGTAFSFADQRAKEMKRQIKKYNLKLTIHSGVTDLLVKDKMIASYQLLLLKSEIKYAGKLGIKHVTFHLDNHLDHTIDKVRINRLLSDILKFAKKHKVQLYLENNSGGPWTKPKTSCLILKNTKHKNIF